MSFKADVIADNSGKWVSNALRFATEKEAQVYVDDLMMRWTAVRDTRVTESDDPVNAELEQTGEQRWRLQYVTAPDEAARRTALDF